MAPETQALCALVGAVCAIFPVSYRHLRHGVTAVHEAGHALVALLVGRRLQAVRLHRDSSGEAVSVGRSRGPGVVVTLLAGYPAPMAAGVCALLCARDGREGLWAAVMVVVLALMALAVRNAFGVLVVTAALIALIGLMRRLDPATARLVVSSVGWFLVVASLRSVGELLRAGRGATDSRSLAGVTHVPTAVWTMVFVVTQGAGAVAALGEEGVKAPVDAVSTVRCRRQ